MADLSQSTISPLFAVLPAELRLNIYEEMFEGSKVNYKKKHTVGGRTQLSILQPSDHCNFLLTCTQAYDEAIKIYWSKTTLHGDPEDDELIFFLDCIVPDLAKPYIRHIRGLNSRELPYRPLEGCLKSYQRLQTIAFEQEWSINVAALGDHGASPTMEDWVAEYCMTQSDWKFSTVLCDNGPTVVVRGVYRLDIGVWSPELLAEKFPSMSKDCIMERKICFYNCSTGYGFFVDGSPSQKEQEAGFAKILDNYTPEREDCEEQLEEHVVGHHG